MLTIFATTQKWHDARQEVEKALYPAVFKSGIQSLDAGSRLILRPDGLFLTRRLQARTREYERNSAMALLFSPLSDDILEGPFKPYPQGVFVMLHSGRGVSKLEQDMDAVVCKCLSRLKYDVKKASRQSGTKDYLEKIVQLIRGCGFGIAIFSEFTPASTLANIFFEVGLCYVLGKTVIIVKSADAKPPSDFVRTEWIALQNGDMRKLQKDVEKAVSTIKEAAAYYESLGDIAMQADEVDVELAFERFRQAILIANRRTARAKIKDLLKKIGTETETGPLLRASRTRLRKSIQEFDQLLPA